MRFSVLAATAAALLGASVSAHEHHHRRHHHARDYHASYSTSAAVVLTTAAPKTCGCTTWYSTFYGEETLVATTTKTTQVTYYTTVPKVVSTETIYPVAEVPTPVVTICPTPGIYTFPATTVTLTATTTVCAAESAVVTAGVHTLGGVTTIVETATSVVCPYAAVETNEGTVISKILTTTYVCPSAGTYTIGAHTVTATTVSTCVYPVPTYYVPGTYVQPAATVTVTLTSQVVFCPYTVPTEAPAPVYSSSAPSSSPAPQSPSKKIGSSGAWSITYSPYTPGGNCKTASEVEIDIADISGKGFLSVRVYSTDCSGLQNVGAACEKHGLKMIIGVFIDNKGIGAASQQVTDIITWNKWSLVQLVVIGNEAIFNGHCSAQELHDFIVSSKSKFKSAGYSGPCTTTETLNVLQQYGNILCDAIDVIGCNVYAFFNSGIDASGAGKFVGDQYELVKGICPGKDAYILETGWPSAGTCNGAACPGVNEQKKAIAGTIAAVGDHAVLFSYSDDMWKQPGAYGVEQHFSCAELF